MRRREFLCVLGGTVAAMPLPTRAQQRARVRRLGVLLEATSSDPEFLRRVAVFVQSLRELGWIEGQNLAIEIRYSEGLSERRPALVTELIESKVDILVIQGIQLQQAARRATATIPIVMPATGDAVGTGLVASLARPGGNVTGLTQVATEQSTKRLQLIKEIYPSLTRLSVVWNEAAASHQLQMKELELAAPVLGIALQSIAIRQGEAVEAGLQPAIQANAQAIMTLDDPVIQSQRLRIIEFAMRNRLPVMGEFKANTDAGALMSYGPNQLDMWRRSASYVDKILKGANPADLPVERPTKFDFVINLKTAKALGLDIPPMLLTRADEVIE
jgi:putative tryptophan/tyrosine transport system substrate-binding protein